MIGRTATMASSPALEHLVHGAYKRARPLMVLPGFSGATPLTFPVVRVATSIQAVSRLECMPISIPTAILAMGAPLKQTHFDRLTRHFSVGQVFSIDLAVNFRNGFKGIDVRDSTTANIFNFNVGNVGAGDDYIVQFAASGNGSIGNSYSSNTAFNLSFTQTSASGGTGKIARSGGICE
jgi:hypothetical protein